MNRTPASSHSSPPPRSFRRTPRGSAIPASTDPRRTDSPATASERDQQQVPARRAECQGTPLQRGEVHLRRGLRPRCGLGPAAARRTGSREHRRFSRGPVHAGGCHGEARQCVDDVAHNWLRMTYPDFWALGLCTSTAVLEAGCKVAIGTRLKRAGMHWTVDGANAPSSPSAAPSSAVASRTSGNVGRNAPRHWPPPHAEPTHLKTVTCAQHRSSER
jgi:hypothetical protein